MASLHNTFTMSTLATGTAYASHMERLPDMYSWMDVVVFDHFPRVPSLVGDDLYNFHTAQKNVGTVDVTAEAVKRLQATHNFPPPLASFRLKFRLFADESPRTVQNFLALCGKKFSEQHWQPQWERRAVPLSYVGTFFHKILPNVAVQGGDLTKRLAGGANHFSTFGKHFADENLRRHFDRAGLLAMANNGPDTNGSQFFVTTSSAEDGALFGRHCCFGEIVEGLDNLMEHLAPFGNDRGDPSRYAVVSDCGFD
jgi:peptidylprolyl isomerase